MNISKSERSVMRVLWTQPNSNAKQISRILPGGHNWAKSTVKTLLARLIKKGAIEIKEKNGRSYSYAPIVSESEENVNLTEDFLGNVCEMKISKLISKIIKESQLDELEIADLLKQLENKTPVKNKHCSCLELKKCDESMIDGEKNE